MSDVLTAIVGLVFILGAAVSAWFVFGSVAAVLTFLVLLGGWLRKDHAPGQGRAVLVFAVGIIAPGLAWYVSHHLVAFGVPATTAGPLATWVSIAAILLSFVGSLLSCWLLARARGRNPLFGLLGLFNLVGFITVMLLPRAEGIGPPPDEDEHDRPGSRANRSLRRPVPGAARRPAGR